MRYKAISLALAVLLIGTPTLAQEVSPIIVETLRTANPTTVITGQPFTQTFVVKFIDLADEGEEIVVQEGGLKPGILDKFEVLKLDVAKLTPPPKQYQEYWWYLTYTLRLINSEKGPYVIKPIVIPWIKKRVGQNITDPSLEVNIEFKTNEVHINYVTTIPEKETYLDILDEINFGSFSQKAFNLRIASWLFGIVPPLAFVVWLTWNRKFIRVVKESDYQAEVLEADNAGLSMLKVVSRKKALRDLKRQVRDFYKLNPDSCKEDDLFDLENDIGESLNNFLRIELSLSVGATPLEMAAYVEKNLKDGRSRKLLASLTETAVFYQQDVERGKISSSVDFVAKTINLKQTLRNMHWYSRIVDFVRRR